MRNRISAFIYIVFCLFVVFNSFYFLYAFPIEGFFGAGNSIFHRVLFLAGMMVFLFALVKISTKQMRRITRLPIKKVLPVIVLAAVLPRLAWVLTNHIVPTGDFDTYHIFAAAMAKGEVIGSGYIALFPNYFAYPAFLALFYRFFQAQAIVAQLLNVLLAGVVCSLIFYICRDTLNQQTGFIASILWAFWPSQILYSELVCTEMLFTACLLFSVYIFIRLRSLAANHWVYVCGFLAAGILYAFTNAVRPLALLLLAATCLYVVLSDNAPPLREALRVKAPVLLSLFIGYFLTAQGIGFAISKAVDRDIAGHPFGFNLYVGLNYDSSGAWNENDSKKIDVVRQEVGANAQLVHDRFMAMSFERFSELPFTQYAALLLNKHKVMWLTDSEIINYTRMGLDPAHRGSFDYFKYERLIVKASNFYYHSMLLLSLPGLYYLIRRRRADIPLFCCIFILCIVLLHLFVEVAGRYHFPAVAFFAILAGHSLYRTAGFSAGPAYKPMV